ncbi:MAG: hypothetical protein HC802_06625 [Caldilineaceae bacterium]|nr:hypothetical protein [Caldilineaceae bacterium]
MLKPLTKDAIGKDYASDLSVQDYTKKTPIDGVQLINLNMFVDDGGSLAEVVRLLPEVRHERPELPDPKPLRESWQRQHFFEALARLFQSHTAPLLLLLDDAQWCDPETLEWLRFLLRYAPNAPLLIVATQRTEEVLADHPLQPLLLDLRRAGQVSEIALGPLDRNETTALASQIGGENLAHSRTDRLFKETEGNPLFVVEMVRSIGDRRFEIGASDTHSSISNRRSLPPKVQAVIEARLAQLSSAARELAGLAATVGQEFTVELLALASDQDEAAVVQALEELWQRRIVQSHSEARYDFSHDKIREVAYASVNPIRLPLHHRRLAAGLERQYGGDLDAVSGRLARHYEGAGLTGQAIRSYRQAAQAARHLHANADAAAFYRRALSLLKAQSETESRDEQEFALQTELGVCVVATNGYAAPEVKQIYTRAADLCERFGRPVDGPILRALAIANVITGDLHTTYALGEAILRNAAISGDQILRVEGHYVLGISSFWMGDFVASRIHLEQAIAQYDPSRHGVHIALYAQDPKVVCLCRLARTLWFLGYPDQAAIQMQHSLELARVLGHPYSQAYALNHASELYLELGDLHQAEIYVDELLALTDKQGIWLWRQYGLIVQYWLRSHREPDEQVILQMQRATEQELASTRNELSAEEMALPTGLHSFRYGWIAAAYLRIGAIEQGLAAIAHAFAGLAKTDERFYEAELHRIHGELLWVQGASADVVEASFQAARQVAQAQQARSLELKAVLSLARFWSAQGQVAEARQALQATYDWFTEGFDTADLKDARMLLQEQSN